MAQSERTSPSIVTAIAVYFAHGATYDPGELHVGTKAFGAGEPTVRCQ